MTLADHAREQRPHRRQGYAATAPCGERSRTLAGVSPSTVAAFVFAVAAAVVIAFQVGLGLGAPWGAYAMGGAFPGRFPPRLRVAAVVQAVLIAGLAVVVLSDADLVLPPLADSLPSLVWVAVGFSALSVVLNAITRSPVERRLWLPVGIVMLASSLVVALG